MALNIKNNRVEELAAEVARLTGETKTEAIRKALEDRRARLQSRISDHAQQTSIIRFLEREVWPTVRAELLGQRMSKRTRESILGYGKDGV
jgi:antitoxin VapB